MGVELVSNEKWARIRKSLGIENNIRDERNLVNSSSSKGSSSSFWQQLQNTPHPVGVVGWLELMNSKSRGKERVVSFSSSSMSEWC